MNYRTNGRFLFWSVMKTKRPFDGGNKRRKYQLPSRGFTCLWTCWYFPAWSSCFQFSLYFMNKGGKHATRYVHETRFMVYQLQADTNEQPDCHTSECCSVVLFWILQPRAFLKRCAWCVSEGFLCSESAFSLFACLNCWHRVLISNVQTGPLHLLVLSRRRYS